MLLRAETEITGAGRTDTGVHASEMYAHFDTHESLPEDLVYRLNSVTDTRIAFFDVLPVQPDAHARFSAVKRAYQYNISVGKNPFSSETSWQLWKEIPDLERMNEAAKWLLGKKDFSAFEKKGSDNATSLCEVYHAGWERYGKELIFSIEANRFLRNMVRAVVGTLVEVGTGKRSPEQMPDILRSASRTQAGLSVPAQGLFLTGVYYPDSIFI